MARQGRGSIGPRRASICSILMDFSVPCSGGAIFSSRGQRRRSRLAAAHARVRCSPGRRRRAAKAEAEFMPPLPSNSRCKELARVPSIANRPRQTHCIRLLPRAPAGRAILERRFSCRGTFPYRRVCGSASRCNAVFRFRIQAPCRHRRAQRLLAPLRPVRRSRSRHAGGSAHLAAAACAL
jgi:hypothetical protein